MMSGKIRQAKIQCYEDRAGRWRFHVALLLDGAVFDIVAQSSDSYATEGEAESMARRLLVESWEVVEDGACGGGVAPCCLLRRTLKGIMRMFIVGG